MFSAFVIAAFFTLLSCLSHLTGACQEPLVSSDVYVIRTKSDSFSFDSGDVLKLACIPGFEPEDARTLTCQDTNEWLGTIPECKELKAHLRWWILLLIVFFIIILVPCTVPHIYYRIHDERFVERVKLLQSSSKTNDFMDKIVPGSSDDSKVEVVLESEASSDVKFHDVIPQPLPGKGVFSR